MNKDELEIRVRNGFLSKLSSKEILDIFRLFKESGGSQSEAIETCAKLIDEFDPDKNIAEQNETNYNKMLDIMDIVSGFCSPQYIIWKM
jgi:hypothetical protein